MSRPVKIVVFVAAIVMLAGAALAAVGDMPMATSSSTDARGDISGPCDEAEHANDPRCTGVQVPGDDDDREVADDDGPGDISGPCDEAEHANDPRCTGVQVAGDDDDDGDDDAIDHHRRGHGSGDEAEDNSGPGSGDDDHDSSGPGSGGDDNSGLGSGDDDHDSSGSGSGDDD